MKNIIGFLIGVVFIVGGILIYANHQNQKQRLERQELMEKIEASEALQAEKDLMIAALQQSQSDQRAETARIREAVGRLEAENVVIKVERDEALALNAVATTSEVVATTKRILGESSIYLRDSWVEFSFSAARNNSGKLIEWESYRFKEVPNLYNTISEQALEIASVERERDLAEQQAVNWQEKFSLKALEVEDWRAFYTSKKRAEFWKRLGWNVGSFLAGMLVEKIVK